MSFGKLDLTSLGLLLVCAVVLGAEKSDIVNLPPFTDRLLLAVFVLEIFFRLLFRRLVRFSRHWAAFDITIVGCAVVFQTPEFVLIRLVKLVRLTPFPRRIGALTWVWRWLLNRAADLFHAAVLFGLSTYVMALVALAVVEAQFAGLAPAITFLLELVMLETSAWQVLWHLAAGSPAILLAVFGLIFVAAFLVVSILLGLCEWQEAVIEEEAKLVEEAAAGVQLLNAEARLMREEVLIEAEAERLLLRAETERILAEIQTLKKEMAGFHQRFRI